MYVHTYVCMYILRYTYRLGGMCYNDKQFLFPLYTYVSMYIRMCLSAQKELHTYIKSVWPHINLYVPD